MKRDLNLVPGSKESNPAHSAQQRQNANIGSGGSANPAQERSIHWLRTAEVAIESCCPQTRGCSQFIAERLASLMIARLPRDISLSLIELLPASVAAHSWPLRSGIEASRKSERAFQGYSEFVDTARGALDCTELDMGAAEMRELADEVARAFLWAALHDLPSELKVKIAEHLPADLRSRMNLYNVVPEDSRVA